MTSQEVWAMQKAYRASREFAEAYQGRAAILYEESKIDYAITDYSLVLSKHKEECGLAQHGLGLVHLAMDHKEKCREHFMEATHDPRSAPTALVNLADLDLKIGRFEDAIERFEKGIGQYPREAGLHLKLSEIYRIKGNMQKAMEHQQEASQLMH